MTRIEWKISRDANETDYKAIFETTNSYSKTGSSVGSQHVLQEPGELWGELIVKYEVA